MLPVLRNSLLNERLWGNDMTFHDYFDSYWRQVQSRSFGYVEDNQNHVYTLSLPANVDIDAIRAEVRDGMLEITIPKPQAKRIEISQSVEGEATEVPEGE